MTIGFNLDLLLVGLAVAASVILGFIVFFRDTRSITNAVFLSFTLVSSALGIVNYLSYQLVDLSVRLWLIRFVMFFSVFQSFSFFLFIIVFPKNTFAFPRIWKTLMLLLVGIIAALTLSPYVFSGIRAGVSTSVSEPIPAPGIFLFAATTISLIVGGIVLLLWKMKHGSSQEKNQLQYLFAGTALMFTFLIGFNFIFPAFLSDTRFVPFNAAFTLPFIVFTFYAILKYRLLNIRVIAAEILMLVVIGVTFFEIVLARSVGEILFRSGVFALLLVFGILLIRSVRREVEQRERMEVLSLELAQANERMEELDKLKSEFVGMAGHQLRAPLTVIKGYVSLIMEGTIDGVSEKAKEALGKVQYSTDQLVKLVSSLLDLSRIESGKIKYEFAIRDFSQMVTEVIDKFKSNAEKKGIGVVFENKIGAASFFFDADKIREAVANYIDNAIKYTEKGDVRVLLKSMEGPDGKWARLEVTDSGMGIKKEDIGLLFTKFSRTDEAKMYDPNGMGIGIYFAKRVVQDHGGNVGVFSEGIGRGSTFWMELPMKR